MISGFSAISPGRVWSSQIGLRKRRKCANDVRRFVKMFAFLKTNSHVSGFFSDIQFLAAIPELLLWVLFFWNPVYKTPTESGVNLHFRRSWAQFGWGVLFGQITKKILCGDFLASPVDFFVTIEISLIILCSGTKISKSQFGKLRNIRLHSGIS